MSLINKMLQDLDKRNAMQDTPETKTLRKQVRPVGVGGVGSEWFWRVLAALILLALGWVGWVIWQLSPHSVVNEGALNKLPSRSPVTGMQSGAPTPLPSPAAATAEETALSQLAMPPLATPMGAALAETPEPARMKLATELASRKAAESKAGKAGAAERPRGNAPATVPSSEAAGPARIERQDPASPQVQAESDYRRGVAFVNQGRVAEGIDALRAALLNEPAQEPARQTLVALMLESRRLDEAARLLREGLVVNPGNAPFATLLARVMVENGDASGALAVLDRPGLATAATPDHRAFRAALLQRLGRHRDAVDEYRAALASAPGVASWWVGLGISQQALGQPREALDAYKRAQSAGNLPAELSGFVEQRVRQLQ